MQRGLRGLIGEAPFQSQLSRLACRHCRLCTAKDGVASQSMTNSALRRLGSTMGLAPFLRQSHAKLQSPIPVPQSPASVSV